MDCIELPEFIEDLQQRLREFRDGYYCGCYVDCQCSGFQDGKEFAADEIEDIVNAFIKSQTENNDG